MSSHLVSSPLETKQISCDCPTSLCSPRLVYYNINNICNIKCLDCQVIILGPCAEVKPTQLKLKLKCKSCNTEILNNLLTVPYCSLKYQQIQVEYFPYACTCTNLYCRMELYHSSRPFSAEISFH